MTFSSFPQDRLKIISKFPEKIKTELVKLNSSLNGKVCISLTFNFILCSRLSPSKMFVSLSKTTLFPTCFAEILLAAVKGTFYVDAISCRIACPIGKRDWARLSRSYYRVAIGQEMFRREKLFESGEIEII